MEISNLKDLDPSGAPVVQLEAAKAKSAPKNVITKLSPGVRDQNRVNVFIDDHFDFSLHLAQVVDFKLKVGKVLTSKELKELRAASEFGKLYQRTLEWVLMRPRSIHETRIHLEQNLKKRELLNRRTGQKPLPLYTSEDISAVITRLESRGYLNDETFARYYLENRSITKGVSTKKLRLELVRKGVSQPLIDRLMSEHIRDDTEEIKKIIAKKASKYDRERLIAYLVRHGFDYQLAQDAVREMDSQSSA